MIAANHEGQPTRPTIDVAPIFDRRPWGGYQMLILALASAAILLDGFDNQALGFALPSIMADWRLPKQALAPALAVSQLGMLIGAISGGWLGDRGGRKRALAGSVALFGIATLLVAFVRGVAPLVLLRFVAGVGLGAAFPNVAAFASEFTPARFRSLAVTICIVCVPLGGVFGGLVAATVLPVSGWRSLFLIAGALTLAITVALVLLLPESVRYLAGRSGSDARIGRILARMGIETSAGATYTLGSEAGTGGGRNVLVAGFRADTLTLWCAFFFCLTSIYAAFGWLPTLLTEQGLDVAAASRGLAAFNIGGVITALVAGWLIGGFGSRRLMISLGLASAIAAMLLMLFPIRDAAGHPVRLFVALAIEGGCVNGVQTTLYALAAQVYPTAMRATGVGAAAGIGRIGAISSSFLGATVIGLGGGTAFHGLIAACMLIVAIALTLLKRHQPAYSRVRTQGAGAPRT